MKSHKVEFTTGTHTEVVEMEDDSLEITMWSEGDWDEIADMENEIVEEIEVRGFIRIK